ncbi:alpha/beta-hydrolase [Pilatotrama ljubarskyi]|nr:alpha/beta-hydrolase [Pilatotrama ljubarskyi]
MEFDVADFTLPGVKEDGFMLSFIRVVPKPRSQRDHQPTPARRLSLLFLHCVASHKETWIPTIEHLFQLQHATPNNAFTIVEAWAMDAPSHGRAAILNESHLRTLPDGLAGKQWARGAHALQQSGLIAGDSVVAIGHSAGACVLILSMEGHPLDRLPYSSLVLVEPGMPSRELLKKMVDENAPLLRAVQFAKTRKNTWPSRQAAREWLAKRLPWRRWDARILDLFIEHALRDLPTAEYPDATEGVTLATTRASEAHGYSHYEDGFEGLDMLKVLCTAMPVHAIFGAQPDMVPAEMQQNIASEEGRRMRSVVRVAGAGHLVVQEEPRGVALALWGILHEDHALPIPAPGPSPSPSSGTPGTPPARL